MILNVIFIYPRKPCEIFNFLLMVFDILKIHIRHFCDVTKVVLALFGHSIIMATLLKWL